MIQMNMRPIFVVNKKIKRIFIFNVIIVIINIVKIDNSKENIVCVYINLLSKYM